MGYYRGDYYRGDYYRGDPGLFGTLGKIVGGVAKAVGGALIPKPVQAVGAAIDRVFNPIVGMSPGPMVVPASGMIPLGLPQVPKGTPGAVPTPGVGGAISRFLPFGDTGYQFPGECNVKGHHLNKSTYVVRGGGTSRYGDAGQMLLIPKGSTCVKNRRMNPANPRALRRAIRRGRGAVKLLRGAAGSMGYTVVTKASLARRPKARRR